MIKIIFCPCPSDYQDKKYGDHKRVHNQMDPKDKPDYYRCTVCGSEKR